jgi:hypothetical protein
MIMARIFINFRNFDGDWAALAIRNALAERFGADEVFLSSFSIPLAADFASELLKHARDCDVLLAIIGPRWFTITGEDGLPRLGAPGDWVCREIETALTAGRKVAPILLTGADPLTESVLPPQIAELARLQACRLDRPRYETDMDGLEEALMRLIPGLAPRPKAIRAQALDIEVTAGKATDRALLEGYSGPAGHDPEGRIRVRADEVGKDAVLRGVNRRDGRKKAE